MVDASKYTITVRKGLYEGDECFEARVAELPDIAEYADTFEDAYELAIDTIEMTNELLCEQGKDMPQPFPQNEINYSGRVTLRIAKTLHRSLVETSNNEDVSLNQHIVNILNYYSGYMHGKSNSHIPSQVNLGWHDSLAKINKKLSIEKPKLKIVSSREIAPERVYM